MGLTYFFSLTVCEVADISRRAHPQPFGDPFSGYRPFPPPPPQRPTAPAFGVRTCPAPYTHLVVVAGILPAVEPGGKTPLLDEVPRLRDRPIQTPARFNLFNLLTLQPSRPAPRAPSPAPRFSLAFPHPNHRCQPITCQPRFRRKKALPQKNTAWATRRDLGGYNGWEVFCGARRRRRYGAGAGCRLR